MTLNDTYYFLIIFYRCKSNGIENTVVIFANVINCNYICDKIYYMKDRLKELLEKENLTAKEFAVLVDIQQSAVSHLLSGRNKPSMDVIQKILRVFKHINPTWLILRDGGMYKSIKPIQGSLFEEKLSTHVNIEANTHQKDENTLKNISEIPVNQVDKFLKTEKKIIRIVVYFSDNSYEEFNH